MDAATARMEAICILYKDSGESLFWLAATLSWLHDHPNIDGRKLFAALRQHCVNAATNKQRCA
jgi:hypothetical protein